MRPLLEIELNEPMGDIVLAPNEDGAGLVFRRSGRPVGFALVDRPSDGTLAAASVARTAASAAGLALVESALRDQLVPAAAPFGGTVTVAVCTRNRPVLLADCLASILASRDASGAASAQLEVLVVDNAPSDERSADLVASMDTVRYAREPRPGLDFARNRALAEAAGDVLAFVDDDVRVDAGWYPGLLRALSEHPDAGGVTGLVLPAELATDAQMAFELRGGFRRGTHKRRLPGGRLPGNALYPAGAGIFGAGCNMAFDRRLLVALGGFDEALDTGPPLPGGGDLDIFYRVARAGRAIAYEPDMLVFHRHRQTWEQLRHQYWTWGTGFLAFVRKSFGSDPANRRQLGLLVGWWFKTQLRALVGSASGRRGTRVDLVAAELAGGVAGLGWEYPASRRRSEAIRREHQ
ncbi:hypothetical protein BH18ACT1_BH18ACT1_01860 [soil metagenome]